MALDTHSYHMPLLSPLCWCHQASLIAGSARTHVGNLLACSGGYQLRCSALGVQQ